MYAGITYLGPQRSALQELERQHVNNLIRFKSPGAYGGRCSHSHIHHSPTSSHVASCGRSSSWRWTWAACPICHHFLTFSLIEIIILPKKNSKPFSRNDTTTTADLCVQCIGDKIQGTEPWTSSFCDERCCNSLNLPSKDPKRVATLVYLLLWCRGSRHLSWNGR